MFFVDLSLFHPIHACSCFASSDKIQTLYLGHGCCRCPASHGNDLCPGDSVHLPARTERFPRKHGLFFLKWNLQKEAFHHFIMNFAVYSDGWKSIVFLNDLVTPCFMAENRKSHPQQTACCGETPPNLTIWMFPLYPGLPLSVGWTLKENRISSVETDEGGKLRAFLGPRSFMILLMQEILHQLRLVVYTIIYRGLYIPDGAGVLPSRVWMILKKKKGEVSWILWTSGNSCSLVILFDLLVKCLISKNFWNGDVFVCGRFDDDNEDEVHKKHMWVLHDSCAFWPSQGGANTAEALWPAGTSEDPPGSSLSNWSIWALSQMVHKFVATQVWLPWPRMRRSHCSLLRGRGRTC